MTDDRDDKGRFLTGNSGGGRPKGSRNKLAEAFIADFHADWEENGAQAIRTMRAERPHEYVKVAASLLPREFKIETVSELSDEQLDARIRQLASLIEVGVAVASDGGEAAEGSATAH
jgi:hypothetical protein